MHKILVAIAALALTTGLAAQQQAPPPPPDAKAPVTVAGKWNVSINTDNGAMASTLDVKVDGKIVSGTITSPQGTTPIKGDFTDGKLTFTLTYDTPNGSLDVTFTGTLKDDNTLAGTVSAGQMGEFPFKADRIKDKLDPGTR